MTMTSYLYMGWDCQCVFERSCLNFIADPLLLPRRFLYLHTYKVARTFDIKQ